MRTRAQKRAAMAAVAASGLVFLWSCGKDSSRRGGGETAPAAGETDGDAPTDPTPTDPTTPVNEGLEQLGDEAIGVKNGEQLVSHYSLMTGLKFEELSQQDRDAILRLKTTLPLDNAAGKFNSAHVLATTKLATVFCQRFIEREQRARNDPAAGLTPVLPDLDWNSPKFPKELAKPLYGYFYEIFWGVDLANLPTRDETDAVLDELVDALGEPYTNAQGQVQNVGLRGAVTALCITSAAAFPSIEL